jgi:hypothetical protein
MSGKRSHHLLRTWILPLVLLAIAVPASAAAKLIHMHNGKVLRVESVQADGEWLVVALDGGHTLGLRAELVARVEDDLGEGNEFGVSPNVVTSGRYVPRGRSGGGFSNRQGGARANRNNALTENSTPSASQPQPGVAVVPGRRPGVAVVPGRQPAPGMQTQGGQPQPAQGLNLTPAAPSRRIRNRPSNN